MRVILAALMLFLVSATSPAYSYDVTGPERGQAAGLEAVPAVDRASTGDGEDDSTSLMMQQVMIGGAIVGGAFAIGVLATGSLATGISAAGAAVLTYTFLP